LTILSLFLYGNNKYHANLFDIDLTMENHTIISKRSKQSSKRVYFRPGPLTIFWKNIPCNTLLSWHLMNN